MLAFLETILTTIINYAILLFEFTGVIIIIIACIKGIWEYVSRHPETRLHLAQGLLMGLEFKLGSEILRTVLVRDLSEMFVVASIIALRALLTFLIHWEIKNEQNAA